jgi:hypothetical protein
LKTDTHHSDQNNNKKKRAMVDVDVFSRRTDWTITEQPGKRLLTNTEKQMMSLIGREWGFLGCNSKSLTVDYNG